MAFWEQQIGELLTGIRELGGISGPSQAPAPDPQRDRALEPFPVPNPNFPVPPSSGGAASPAPQHPPNIPERDMDLSSGMPRSTLDGIHDDGGVIIKKPGELGPPAYRDAPPYTESPPGSGVWVPDNRPPAPGSTLPMSSSADGNRDDWSGNAADAAGDTEASLRRTRAVLDEADRRLQTAVTDAHSAAATSRAQLQRIHDEVTSGVAALQPSMQTPAGRVHMADLLEAKAQQAKEVATEAQANAARLAAVLSSLANSYSSSRQV